MSEWDKMIARICGLSKDLRFDELRKVYVEMVRQVIERPGCITCGETIESAVANAVDAKKAWLEAALEEGIEISEPDGLEAYSGQFKLRVPRSLHRALAEHSKREGISMNQYCVYLLSKNDVMFSAKN